MNTVSNPGLKKSVARAFLAGGLGLAVMGLGAGMANAEPAPTPMPPHPTPSLVQSVPGLPGPRGPVLPDGGCCFSCHPVVPAAGGPCLQDKLGNIA
jgi:hypothetical protein